MDNFERLNGFEFPDNDETENNTDNAQNNTYNTGGISGEYQNPVYTVITEPVKKQTKKKGRFKTAVAAVLSVALIGGASGFGGVYFGYNYFASESEKQIVQLPESNSNAVETTIKDDEVLLAADTLAKNTTNKEMTPSELFEKVKDTVVGIKLYENVMRGRQVVSEGSLVGSGVIFTTDGYILTNYHVITDYEKIGVLVSDYDDPTEIYEYEAEIVGTDEPTDLAILKITRSEPFKAAPIGDSSSLKVGQYVCPIGYPLGLEKSMTLGIVSGLNREVEAGGYELSSIQIDAAVNMGNSGGPLFDMYGNVVGIVNKKLVYDNLVENMGFAITIDEAKPVINDLLAYGEITSRPVIGINTYELNQYVAQMYGLNITEGLLVYGINSSAPVSKSGLAVGDVITKVNGVEVYSVTDVQTLTKNLKAGDTIDATVVRYSEYGEKSEIIITIELTSKQSLE